MLSQREMKFPMLIKIKMLKNNDTFCFKTIRCCICLAHKCQNANNFVGILTFISMINFMLSKVEHEKSFINSEEKLNHP